MNKKIVVIIVIIIILLLGAGGVYLMRQKISIAPAAVPTTATNPIDTSTQTTPATGPSVSGTVTSPCGACDSLPSAATQHACKVQLNCK